MTTFWRWAEGVAWVQSHYQTTRPMAEWELLRLRNMSEEDFESGNWPARVVPVPGKEAP